MSDRRTIYKKAIQENGQHMQQMVAIEEMSELIKELVKYSRGADNKNHIAEEIADVIIMLEQLIVMFGNATEVKQYKEQKIIRLQERLCEVRRNV